MKSINFYSLKQVKEKSARYDLESKFIRKPEDARNIIHQALDLESEANEKFVILTLNTKNVVVGIHIISVGTLNSALVHPREVFKAALLNNAASIICAHNHPSGDCTPSPEDIQMTKRLSEAGQIVGIEVLDHLVIGDQSFRSFKEEGYL